MVAALAMAINPCAVLCGGPGQAMPMSQHRPMPAPKGHDDPPMSGCHACLACGRAEEED